MWYEDTPGRTTTLDSYRAHVSVISVVTVRMMQADVNAEIDLMVLWIPPARVDDLVSICRSVDRTIGNTKVNAIVTIVINPITETI